MRTIIHNVIIDGQKKLHYKSAQSITYNDLSQKTRFESVPTAVLGLYNILLENLVFLNLSVSNICTFIHIQF